MAMSTDYPGNCSYVPEHQSHAIIVSYSKMAHLQSAIA